MQAVREFESLLLRRNNLRRAADFPRRLDRFRAASADHDLAQGEFAGAPGRPPDVGPYRDPAEDLEAELDAREVAAFRALLERRGWRVRAGVLLTMLGVVGGAATVVLLVLHSGLSAATSPEPRAPRCVTRLVTPRAGDPFPMTICH